MKRDGRLSGVLHVLLHLAEQSGPVTSEDLAKAMDTNPVVIRRIMAGLRDQGYFRSEKGHGGGWTLVRDLSEVTLRDVYAALGNPSLLAIGNRAESPGCPPCPGARAVSWLAPSMALTMRLASPNRLR